MRNQPPVRRPRSADEVRRAVPALDPAAEIRPVDEGGEHSTWRVGGTGVLRLALDADGSRRQHREIALRDTVRRHTRIPLPASVLAGFWAPGLSFTLDAALPGVSAERRPVTRAGEEDLAGLLAALRTLPAAVPAALGVPRESPRAAAPLYEEARGAGERLRSDGEFPRGPLTLAAGGDGVPGPSGEALLHHDLKGEHLLVTPSGGIGGVLDWTDAALGDPAEDVAGLAIAVGAPAAVRIALGAGHDAAVCRRALFLARADTLIRLSDRLHGDDDSPPELLRAQRTRAWRPTALDRDAGADVLTT
ncbi:aminoglycoside phosphotransferase family protein [Streptomyces sp. NPDC014894]|uniref:aminoglycoside phosphotransferase family protein n=1 Tax=Streptomyces sp. NPDC014894 TaxID=3364931 RepID=UPI0036FCD107